jgi:hypothetical protein
LPNVWRASTTTPADRKAMLCLVIWRYPGSGQLRTSGEGSCTEDWIP